MSTVFVVQEAAAYIDHDIYLTATSMSSITTIKDVIYSEDGHNGDALVTSPELRNFYKMLFCTAFTSSS